MNDTPRFTKGTENPFRSPHDVADGVAPPPLADVARPNGYVRHISIVATLMIIHGVLLLLCACGAFAIIGAFLIDPSIAEQSDPLSMSIIKIIYGLVGSLLSLVGLLQLAAGIRNLDFKNRMLGFVALCFGLLPIFTFWCGPTSIALTVYGLVVYLQPECRQAFELRREGHSKEEVLNFLNA